MNFPYGEGIILFLALATWTEKGAAQRFFLRLLIAWLMGLCLEVVFPSTRPWHWDFARLAVMLVFWGWAWQRAERRIFPLLFTSCILSMETLFLVNEPGVIPYGAWLFTFLLILAAWLTGKSFWGTAATFTGSLLLNQALVRFTYEGLVRYVEFPDPFVWNFGVAFLVCWAGFLQGQLFFPAIDQEHAIDHATDNVEQLVSANAAQDYEPSEQQELL